MRLSIVSLFAAALLLAACETSPEAAGGAAGTGGAMGGDGSGVASQQIPGPEPGSQEDLVANVGDRVFFDFDRYHLTQEAQETLQAQADWLKGNPQVTVTVEGHCDERGTREYNLALGERRANAVKSYLVALGVDPGRISTISYGKERPAVLGSNEVAWAQNRRAVTVVN